MASTKRNIAEVASDAPPRKRVWMEGRVSDQAVKELVEYYNLNENQEKRLKFVADRTKFVPTVDEVEWLVTEAKLRDGNKELDFFMFPYMEYYAWYFRSKKEDFRLYTGAFVRYNGLTWPVWMRFGKTMHGPKTWLYLYGPDEGPKGQKGALNPQEYRRIFITWWEPFDHLFQLARMNPEDPKEKSKAKIAASLQNDYFKATAKVLARFPGLIMERDPDDDSKRRQVYGDFSMYPFLEREKFSPANPLAKLLKIFGWDVEVDEDDTPAPKRTKSDKNAPNAVKTAFKSLEFVVEDDENEDDDEK